MFIIRAVLTVLLLGLLAVVQAQIQARLDDGSGLHVFYRTSWATPFIHYNDGVVWTVAPGTKLTPSKDRVYFPSEAGWFQFDLGASRSSLEFVFNNGMGVWDNNGGKNYKATSAGAWIVTSAVSGILQNPPVLVKSASGNNLTVLIRTGWTTPYIHFNAGVAWTTPPGQKLAPSSDPLFPAVAGWFQFTLSPFGTGLEFVLNDGNSQWDNNGSKNYRITGAGTWAITSSITTPPYPIPLSPSPNPPTPSSGRPLPTAPTPTSGAPPSPTTPQPTQMPTPTFPANSCANFNGQDSCVGNNVNMSPDSEARRWQTPPRNSTGWLPSYQDYRSLQAYAHVVYAGDRLSATVTVRTTVRVPTATCTYSFNGGISTSAVFQVDSSLSAALNVIVTCASGVESWTLVLDPVNFVWQNAAVPTAAGLEGGQKGAIVDLFGWPYRDIENECRDFLGKAGYLGVKINPPQEAVFTDAWPQDGQRNPWYFVYQPVSYRLYARMGSRAELRSMIQTCRANGVRVYADAVVNHMVGGGNDVNPTHRNSNGGYCARWGPKSSTAKSPYYTAQFAFETNPQTGQRPGAEFPAVPYGPSDFHCERSLNSYTDPLTLSAGWLEGLLDLNTGKTSVRERIAQYFVDLLGIGFSGFRIDAMKHIGPVDTAAIMGLVNQYMGGSLPDDFLMWGEVILGGEAQLLACNPSSGYNFYTELDQRYAAAGISAKDITKLKIWSSDYPKEFPICGSWILPSTRFVVQNDDHDQQQPGSSSRDMGDRGSVLVKQRDVAAHRNFEVLLFNRRDGDWKIKVVLSSYTIFPDNTPAGFPDGLSDCSGFDPSAGQTCTRSVPYERAFRAGSCGYTVEGFSTVGKYTRVHRDLAIVNAMRNWVGLPAVASSDVGLPNTC
ncbi:hypothetical protein PINS_up002153 [Pythium insidiosum]|nr:hypothetical protein PINS_up002153 [Pythium insidiosum]